MNRSERHQLHKASGDEQRDRALRRELERQALRSGVQPRDSKGRFAKLTDGQPHLLDLLRASVKATRKGRP